LYVTLKPKMWENQMSY